MTNQSLPNRYAVNAGIDNGQPFIEVVDNLAVAGLRFPLIDALQIQGLMSQAAVALLATAQEQNKRQRQGIVRANGAPVKQT